MILKFLLKRSVKTSVSWTLESTVSKMLKIGMLFCFKFLLKRLFSWEIGRFNFIWKWPNLIWAFHPILVTSFFGCFWQRSYQYITFVCFLFCLTHFGLKTENIVQKITQPKWWKTKNNVTKICDEPSIILIHFQNLMVVFNCVNFLNWENYFKLYRKIRRHVTVSLLILRNNARSSTSTELMN